MLLLLGNRACSCFKRPEKRFVPADVQNVPAAALATLMLNTLLDQERQQHRSGRCRRVAIETMLTDCRCVRLLVTPARPDLQVKFKVTRK